MSSTSHASFLPVVYCFSLNSASASGGENRSKLQNIDTDRRFLQERCVILNDYISGNKRLKAFPLPSSLSPRAMQQTWFMVIVILYCLGQNDTLGIQACQPQPTCSECLRSPGCAWCKQKDFLKPGEANERRCDSAESLQSRKCANGQMINPKSPPEVKKDRELSSTKENVIQLKPQSIHLKLRIGQPSEFKVSFKRAVGYPIDLYYLMDLSFSMKDDLDNIKDLGKDILTTLEQFTKDRHIGFGSFVDKVALPYVSQLKSRLKNPCPNRLEKCQPAFSFRNVLPLTKQAERFKVEVGKQKISGNLDSPEAGLDAIMQSVVCRTEIGWRNVTSILVYTSDDTFHMAGDGRLAGIYSPHDGQCHLDGTSTYEGTLQALSELIPRSVVGVLTKDSSNVVQLISDAYRNLSSSIVFEHEHAPAGLAISYRSLCEGGQYPNWSSRGECSGVKLDQQVNFTVRLNATACLAEMQQFSIKVQGISDILTVFVETFCDCDGHCQDREEKAPDCKGNGTFHCGMCSCDGMHLGQHCECEVTDDFDSMKALSALCRQTNKSEICDGHGDCECGKCSCHSHYRGDYCECDDKSCSQDNNMQWCNGKGSCNCGKCLCEEGYTGESCHCPVDKRDCIKGDGLVCSGQGECPCDRCICNGKVTGKYCQSIQEPCSKKYQTCTLCAVQKGEDCNTECDGMTTKKVPGPQEYVCLHEGLTFQVKVTDEGLIQILYADLPQSIDKTHVIIGSSVISILLIGIVVIIVYRLLIELYDRNEYRNFLNAQKQTTWNEQNNPLFQEATTTVMNPLHEGDD
ncbi:integrin beta-7-like isoform X2 [Clupea harengus]|uniref:Integrin beta n=1 Tax=Clupea harengus TaxID=7950 RepID=A0A6P3VQB5_CLUHA|nr:integrin beta-7-like isoform X2 [Clupea harengus]